MPFAHWRQAAVLALALAAAGCGSPLVKLGTVLADAALPTGDGQQGRLLAEIVEIDELQRRLRVTTEDGRTGTVLYDQNTVVVSGQQHLTVRSLQPGDLVLMQVRQDRNDLLYTDRIDIQPREGEPVPADPPADQEPAATPADPPGDEELERFTGTVRLIDRERATFVVETSAADLRVSLPDDAPPNAIGYFQDMRPGDTVDLEGVRIGTGRVEVRRFLSGGQ